MSGVNVIKFPVRLTPEQNANVEKHLFIVEVVAKELVLRFGHMFSLKEMMSAGREGLVLAAQRYTKERGIEFKHFAWYRVEGAILDEIKRDARRAKMDAALRRGLEDFADTPRGDGHYRDRDRAIEEQIERCVTHAVDSMVVALCAHAARSAEEHYVDHELNTAVAAAVKNLPDSQRKVIEKRYYEEREMDEIAAEMNLAGSTVRLRQQEAMEKIRRLLEAEGVLERKKKAGGGR